MAKQVLVVHGAGEPKLRNGKVYWQPLLEKELGAGYVVGAPRMPEPEEPDYAAWAAEVERRLRGLETPLLVGHSFGGSVLLKYLCLAEVKPKLAGLFLVSTPFWGEKFPEYALPKDFGARLRDVSPLYFYHSRDDAAVPVEHVERYRRALPHAVVRVLDGRGHEFDQPHFPELAADLRAAGD